MAYQSNYGRSSYSNGYNRPPVKMHDVSSLNIKCCDCGVEIKELPFEPDPERISTLRCRDCMRKKREQFRSRY